MKNILGLVLGIAVGIGTIGAQAGVMVEWAYDPGQRSALEISAFNSTPATNLNWTAVPLAAPLTSIVNLRTNAMRSYSYFGAHDTDSWFPRGLNGGTRGLRHFDQATAGNQSDNFDIQSPHLDSTLLGARMTTSGNYAGMSPFGPGGPIHIAGHPIGFTATWMSGVTLTYRFGSASVPDSGSVVYVAALGLAALRFAIRERR